MAILQISFTLSPKDYVLDVMYELFRQARVNCVSLGGRYVVIFNTVGDLLKSFIDKLNNGTCQGIIHDTGIWKMAVVKNFDSIYSNSSCKGLIKEYPIDIPKLQCLEYSMLSFPMRKRNILTFIETPPEEGDVSFPKFTNEQLVMILDLIKKVHYIST